MMTKMRQMSKVFIIIIAAAFIALMVFQWGMDFTGRSKVDNVVGIVNGKELTYQRFSELYQQMYQNYRAQTGRTDFSEVDLQRLRDQVWDQFIQRTILTEQMEKLGITVSDSEVVYQVYNYPLEELKQHPAFKTNGIFDINKYRASFTNPEIPWRQIEEIYRQQIPFIKLQNIITNTVRVTEEEVLEEFKKRNLKTKVEYLSILPGSFNNDLQASEDEIKNFYEEHKEEYKQEEMRDLAYVIFPIKTTAKDTAHLMQDFEQIKERLKNGEEFSQLALEYSDDPSVKNNKGDLGYFSRGSMVKAFEDAAFAAKKGDIIGPIETNYGFHLIYVEDKRVKDGKEEVKASHILMKVNPAPSYLEEQESKARFFSEDAKDKGFEAMAKQEGYTVLRTGLFEEQAGFIPGIGNNPAIMNFAFSSKLNDVSGIYRLEDKGYAVFSVATIKPAGYRPLDEVRTLIENRVKLEKAKNLAKEYALSLQKDVKSGKSFKEIADAQKDGKIYYDVTPMFTMETSIPRVGRSVEFTATAFALDVGETSDLVETERGFYYLKVLEKTPFDSAAFKAQKKSIHDMLLTRKKNQIFTKWYEDLKAKADIVDRRKKFGL